MPSIRTGNPGGVGFEGKSPFLDLLSMNICVASKEISSNGLQPSGCVDPQKGEAANPDQKEEGTLLVVSSVFIVCVPTLTQGSMSPREPTPLLALR